MFKRLITALAVLLSAPLPPAHAAERSALIADAFFALCLSGNVESALAAAQERGDADVDNEQLYASHQGTYYTLRWGHEPLDLILYETIISNDAPRPLCSIGFSEQAQLVVAELQRRLGPGTATTAGGYVWPTSNGRLIEASATPFARITLQLPE